MNLLCVLKIIGVIGIDPFSRHRLIGRPLSVVFKLNELAHLVEEFAEEEQEAEDLPEVIN